MSKKDTFTYILSPARVLMAGALCLATMPFSHMAEAQGSSGQRPALVISNSPVPDSVLDKAYRSPVRTREITPEELTGRAYYKPTETMVSRRLKELESELALQQDKLIVLSDALNKVSRQNEGKAAQYYAAVATINTQLQAGTTPGNPRLVERFSTAERTLDGLGGQVTDLNQLALDAGKLATEVSYLLDATRSAYSLSGAVEEDHVRLAEIEDQTNATTVMVERLLTSINDDLRRTNAYLASERENLRVLSLAVTQGNFYGYGLANRPFSGTGAVHQATYAPQPAPPAQLAPVHSDASMMTPPPVPHQQQAPAQGLRPLVKIKFDSANVQYEQPLYTAVNTALERYPNTVFHVVALHPSQGNAAETAIESTRSRRDAKRVLRTLSQFGVSDQQIKLSHEASPNVGSSEVHIFIQ